MALKKQKLLFSIHIFFLFVCNRSEKMYFWAFWHRAQLHPESVPPKTHGDSCPTDFQWGMRSPKIIEYTVDVWCQNPYRRAAVRGHRMPSLGWRYGPLEQIHIIFVPVVQGNLFGRRKELEARRRGDGDCAASSCYIQLTGTETVPQIVAPIRFFFDWCMRVRFLIPCLDFHFAIRRRLLKKLLF